ncbi:tRNA (adenosine(37)-N6)-threonylcarbamoyltransferase complex dimerization subunit type 1 TsaB [Xanthomonadaceae bacterium JHOS43]|nr:tRNA (adenosine(37)-N6)-threonylcarbamoyltransferase complex dimerization subunit type 1 TsaB [Xanthomonadaceae bacterium JHOS43]MCX7563340.1 tRNA (adenosine(37)-N6)-threonylcarbamoyltransferase complex dimerization subunit type 1 TsaB [Xanthomonadaceae bacterium XH05]
MKLLALETATEACSVALYLDGDVCERFELAPRRHAELALPWIDALLAEAGVARSQLDAIACGRGPGAFTGVRLAVAMVQGLALALDRPAIGISTLRTLAYPAMRALEAQGGSNVGVLAAIDARMGEVYLADYRRGPEGEWIAVADECVIAPAAAMLPESGQRHGVGTGFAAERGVLAERFAPYLTHVDAAALPHAADTARLAALALERGEGTPPEYLQPAYLRNNVALTLAEQGKPVPGA